MGNESLQNSRSGIDVAGHNIANVNDKDFSRQVMHLETKHPVRHGEFIFGSGARLQGIRRAHDEFLEKRIVREGKDRGYKTELETGLKRIEGLFNTELSATLRDRFTKFFNAMREMANFPSEPALRTNLVESGVALTQAFHSTHSALKEIQRDYSKQLAGEIKQLNAMLKEVSQLNIKIREFLDSDRSPPNDFLDRRDALVREISEVMEIHSYKNEWGQLVIRGPNDSLLVEGKNAARFRLEYREKANSIHADIMLQDLTKKNTTNMNKFIDSGKLGAIIDIRDDHTQRMLNEFNSVAKNFGETFNAIHREGYGLGSYSRMKGRDFFHGLEKDGDAMENIEMSNLIMNDIDAIGAGMTIDAPGDNMIANSLLKISYKPIVKGEETLGEAYDRVVGELGFETKKAMDEARSANIVMSQLEGQRQSVSGVALDEEATNLMKHQHLFNASSKLITTVDEMFQTILDLKRW